MTVFTKEEMMLLHALIRRHRTEEQMSGINGGLLSLISCHTNRNEISQLLDEVLSLPTIINEKQIGWEYYDQLDLSKNGGKDKLPFSFVRVIKGVPSGLSLKATLFYSPILRVSLT